MSETTQKPSANNPDQIIEDEKSLAIKDKVLARQKTSSFLNAISKAAMYLGGVITTAATGAALGAIFHSSVGLLAAFGGPVGIALAIGTTIIAAGIATDYAQSRIWQSCTFDNLEANADSTARHLVKELKVNNMCMTTEHESHCRKDGRTWTETIKTPESQQQAQVTGRV